MVDFKKELNEAQYEVVANGTGPVLVLAGAGSGKTRTLVYRVAYLLAQGVKPERILLLTFTNKAANEMLSRVRELVDASTDIKKMWGGTFHHVANRLLRRMGSAIDLKNNFTILDREDSKSLIKRICKELGTGPSKRRLPQPGIFLDVISYAMNAQVSLEDALSIKYPEGIDRLDAFQHVAAEYSKRKAKANAVDFDDLLTHWLRLLQKPALRKKLSSTWEYILVDEYQDTNTVQDAIVRALASEHGNILVVGDDAQSIYSFRAADIENILQFPKRFPNARIYKLEENYRSTPEILDVANNVIGHNTGQFKKTLFTEQDSFVKPEVLVAQDAEQEAQMIADRIMAIEDEGEQLSHIAVLFRAAHNSQQLELELNRRRIPYDMRGGLRFFERAHIKDVLAFLRILNNSTDEASWYRVLNLYEGIGEVTAHKLFTHAQTLDDWEHILQATPKLSEVASKGWRDFMSAMTALYADRELSPGGIIRTVMQHYKFYAELQFTDYKDRLEDIEQLGLFGDGYDLLEDFLAETTLQEAHVVKAGKEHHTEDGVILSTIHQAKGLEWNTVFLINVTNQSLPHPKALQEDNGVEEERRLFYVAITRARRRLYLTYPLSSSRYSMSINQPSQFIKEIDQSLITGGVDEDDGEQYIDVDSDGGFLPSVDTW